METERTRLTWLIKEDFAEVLAMFNEPGIATYIKHLENLSREAYEAVLNKRLMQIENKVGYHWTARLKSTGEFIGALNLSPIPNMEVMQIGFQLRSKFWNQGFASELAREVLAFGLNQVGLKNIYGVFKKENVASGKVLTKLGFTAGDNKIFPEEEVEVYKYNSLKVR